MAMPAEEYESESDEDFISNSSSNVLEVQNSTKPANTPEKASSHPVAVPNKPTSRIPRLVPVINGINVEDFRMAVIRGNITSTKDCIDKGIELNMRFKTGWTALMYASHYCNNNLVSLLLSHGASVTTEPGSLTPLMTTCISNISREKDVVECVQQLVDAGSNVSDIDQYEMTPLMMACKKNHSGVVHFLLDHGAQVNKQDRQGWSALCYACNSGNVETVKLLICRGAETSVQTLRGQTPLSLASSHTRVLEYIRTLPEFSKIDTNGFKDVEEETKVRNNSTASPSFQSPSFQSPSFQSPVKPAEARNGFRGFSRASNTSNSSQGPSVSHSENQDTTATLTASTLTASTLTALPVDNKTDEKKADQNKFRQSIVTDYGDLEMFLFGLELPQLIPLFNQHNINFAHLLCITDDELIKVGVNSVGWRKKILDNITEVHKKDWKASSIPGYDKVQAGKDLSCSETISIIANLGSQSSYMNTTMKFVQSEIGKHPALLQPDKSGQSVHALRKFIYELEGNCKHMSESCHKLRIEVEETLHRQGEVTGDQIVRSATEKSGSRKVVYVLAGITVITIICSVAVSSRWAKLPNLSSIKFWNK